MTCSLCDPIGDCAVANTGRDEYFGPPVTSLVSLDLGRYDDLRECPECGAVFHFNEYTAQTGSGNNDEDTVTRLSPAVRDTVHAIVRPAGARTDEQVAALTSRILAAPADVVRDLIGALARRRDRELARRMVPSMLDAAEQDAWAVTFVRSVAASDRLDDAKAVREELTRRPAIPALAGLRRHVAAVTCTICREIPTYPPTQGSRDSLPALKRCGASDEIDLWECPECDSMFLWKSADGVTGGLGRIYDTIADAARACVHRQGAVPMTAMETVFACGDDYQQAVVRYGLRRDHELVRQLAPVIHKSLKMNPNSWLHALKDQLP